MATTREKQRAERGQREAVRTWHGSRRPGFLPGPSAHPTRPGRTRGSRNGALFWNIPDRCAIPRRPSFSVSRKTCTVQLCAVKKMSHSTMVNAVPFLPPPHPLPADSSVFTLEMLRNYFIHTPDSSVILLYELVCVCVTVIEQIGRAHV